MSKPFPDLRTDEEAEDWLQNADLTEYDLSDLKKAPFELAPRTPLSTMASALPRRDENRSMRNGAGFGPAPHVTLSR